MKKNSNLKFTEFFLSKYKDFDFKFHILIAGARFGYDDIFNIFQEKLNVTCFEQDHEESNRLNKFYNNERFNCYPYFLSDKNEKKIFYNYNHKSSSSLYKINKNFLRKFHNEKNFEIENPQEITTTTLNSIFEKEKMLNVDFMQIDCEGAELDILKGASKLLNNTLCIESEILLQRNIRINAPSFSNLDDYLNTYNFSLYDLHLLRFSKVPGETRRHDYRDENGNKVPGPTLKGQLLAGDALYFKNMGLDEDYKNLTYEEIVKYIFLFEIFFMEDSAYDLINSSKEIIEKNTDRTYLEFLNFFY